MIALDLGIIRKGHPVEATDFEGATTGGTEYIRRTQLGVDMFFRCASKFGFPEGTDPKGKEEYRGPKSRYQVIYGSCELGKLSVDVNRKSLSPHFAIQVQIPTENRTIEIVTRAGFKHFGSGTAYFRDYIAGKPKNRPGTTSLHEVSEVLDRILNSFQLERVEEGSCR